MDIQDEKAKFVARLRCIGIHDPQVVTVNDDLLFFQEGTDTTAQGRYDDLIKIAKTASDSESLWSALDEAGLVRNPEE